MYSIGNLGLEVGQELFSVCHLCKRCKCPFKTCPILFSLVIKLERVKTIDREHYMQSYNGLKKGR